MIISFCPKCCSKKYISLEWDMVLCSDCSNIHESYHRMDESELREFKINKLI